MGVGGVEGSYEIKATRAGEKNTDTPKKQDELINSLKKKMKKKKMK